MSEPTVKIEPGDVVLWSHHKCNRCPYQTKSLDVIRKHLQQHKNRREFVCDKCPPEKYKCKICYYSVNTLINYNTHMKNAHSKPSNFHKWSDNSITKFKCDGCKFGTFSQLMYIFHVKNCKIRKVVEFIKKPPKPRRMQRKSSNRPYKTPLAESLQKTNETFHCKLCPFSKGQRQALINHVKSIHMSKGLFKCDWCSFSGLRAPVLMRHIGDVHTLHKCDLCSFVCAGSISLKEHAMVKHIVPDGMKPQQCVHCQDQLFNFIYRDKKYYLCGCLYTMQSA